MPFENIIAPPNDDLRQWLRSGTQADHDRLDSLLGACDLQSREGMSHFLLAHAIGLSRIAPLAAGFMNRELGLTMPDPCAMVEQDLSDLSVSAPWPEPTDSSAGGAGFAYVLIGSRMGVAALCKQGYWSPGTDEFSRYMQDRSLLALWLPLLGWLRQTALSERDKNAALADARAGFAAFEIGLEQATCLLAAA